ncbi:MAG: PQQ-dependent sugar dehydrogenase [Acidimicrobiia bacterium]|nr:PQQ-dependent sugar dehydrogenase [Acidimicrobiia bacterium]
MLKGVVTRPSVRHATALARAVPDLTTLSGVLASVALCVGATTLIVGLTLHRSPVVVLGPQSPPPAPAAPATQAVPAVAEPPASDLIGLRVREFVAGLDQPTAAVAVPSTDLWYLLERTGIVRVASEGDLWPDPALDISSLVSRDAVERGLMGIALHPAWSDNGRVFLSYTNLNGDLVVAEFEVDPGSLEIAGSTQTVLLVVEHADDGIYHLGGPMAFGPDGYLWVGVGDGSNPIDRDAYAHGPNPYSLQGTLLRIDVDAEGGWAVPDSNPFADGFGGAPEVWAFGFRNPWTFSFDDGRLFVADVGHEEFEEINVIPLDGPGGFFGWSWWEGDECLLQIGCDDSAIAPTVVFSHPEMCAIIGGFVYRGSAIPELVGRYLFADFCRGEIRTMVAGEPSPEILPGSFDPSAFELPAIPGLSRFAVDDSGEIYVLQIGWGRMFKIEPVRLGPEAG